MKLNGSCFYMFAVVLFLLSAIVGQAQVTAIKVGKLVDPEMGTTSVNQTIIVEGRKIKAIGAGLAVSAGATVIDLSNSTVLPGLFDTHAHMLATICFRRRATDDSSPAFQGWDHAPTIVNHDPGVETPG